MKNLAKILYGINGITCIFIGLMHTYAHYTDLVTNELKEILNHQVIVSGIETNVWKLWQGMSLMMGALLVIIGLLQLLILKRLDKQAYPPVGGSLIMILMLFFVVYVGYHFFSIWQVYGGSLGLILQMICLILTFRKESKILAF